MTVRLRAKRLQLYHTKLVHFLMATLLLGISDTLGEDKSARYCFGAATTTLSCASGLIHLRGLSFYFTDNLCRSTLSDSSTCAGQAFSLISRQCDNQISCIIPQWQNICGYDGYLLIIKYQCKQTKEVSTTNDPTKGIAETTVQRLPSTNLTEGVRTVSPVSSTWYGSVGTGGAVSNKLGLQVGIPVALMMLVAAAALVIYFIARQKRRTTVGNSHPSHRLTGADFVVDTHHLGHRNLHNWTK